MVLHCVVVRLGRNELNADSEERNFLDMVPSRVYEPVPTDDGLMRIDVPKFKNPIGLGFCRILRLGENIGIKLDEVGSFIYERCDGGHTVGDIVSEAKRKFGDGIEPAVPRVQAFFRVLELNKLISFQSDDSHGPE